MTEHQQHCVTNHHQDHQVTTPTSCHLDTSYILRFSMTSPSPSQYTGLSVFSDVYSTPTENIDNQDKHDNYSDRRQTVTHILTPHRGSQADILHIL